MHTKEVLEKANTVTSACREWLEIVLFRIISSARVTSGSAPIKIHALVTRRALPDTTLDAEVIIKGVARHPRIAGKVRFTWQTRVIDSDSLRRIAERIGHGEFEYIGRTTPFMLETSSNGTLWVRLLSSSGEPSPIRYSMSRGKMRPPLSETRH